MIGSHLYNSHSMTEPEFHMIAFAGYVRFVTKQPSALSAYLEATGDTYQPPQSAIEGMIDHATGAGREFVRRFIDWCGGQYGRDYLPADFVDRMAPNKAAA